MLVTETQRDVTGIVRLKLYKGNIIVAAAKVPRAFTIRALPPWKPTLRLTNSVMRQDLFD